MSDITPTEIIAVLSDIQQRSQQSAIRLADEDNTIGSWTAIGFRMNNNNFLIPLNETREIFPVPKQVSPVPKAQPWVLGVANLRGELLPLFDLKYFLYQQPTRQSKRCRIIVNNDPSLYSGLLVDEVFGLKHFQHAPETNTISTTQDSAIKPYLTGSITQATIRWDVFSLNKLTTDQRFLNVAL